MLDESGGDGTGGDMGGMGEGKGGVALVDAALGQAVLRAIWVDQSRIRSLGIGG